jgi:glycosyltransferase involved in cell wall biosynthesis
MSDSRVIVCIPCLLLGGSELATLSFVKALIRDGYDVTVCCYHEHDATMVARFEQAGAKVVLLDLSRRGLRHVFSTLASFFRWRQPDVVHVQYFAPGMVPILAARHAGVKYVFATVHTAGQRGYGWKAKAMLRFSALFTDHFFCVSQNAEQFWFGSVSRVHEPSQWHRTSHSTIHNGIDVQAIQAAGGGGQRSSFFPALPADAQVVGIVGSLVQLKGHSTLLQALATVVREMPQTHLLVIGSGADEAQFRREADALGVADHVLWRGRVEPEVLPQYYHTLDVLGVPSHWEGFGLTAAEAMAAGKPVVGTDVPGLREVVEDGVTGYLVPVGDVQALAEKLLALLSDRRLARQMGSNGLRRVRRMFDVTHVGRKWTRAYQALLAD